MHTLHWWAVEAEDKEEAFYAVSGRLINDDGANFVDWSDWHVVGGGRWSDSQYENSSDMIVSYRDEPEKFNEMIELCKKNRMDEMNRYLKEIKTDKFISDMVDYISNSGLPDDKQRFSMNSYYVQKAGELLMDNYTCDSYFYDMVEYTAHMGYLPERLDNPAKKMLQFLVPIDFHF
jgi:hypothetical protein